MMEEAELIELAADIKGQGLLEPIALDSEGRILDGRNRYMACRSIGIEPQYVTIDTAEPVAYVVSKNLKRRHLTEPQRAMVAARVATLKPWRPAESAPIGALSQRKAAEMLSVSRRSIQRARQVISRGIPELVEAVDAGDIPVSAAVDAVEAPPEEQQAIVGLIRSGAAKTVKEAQQQLGKAHVAYNSGESEWYTPPEYIAAAREVMGGIDLDPASCAVANETVGASCFYSIDDDGLTKHWAGRVWLNPPYSQPAIGKFCARLLSAYTAGNVTAACALVNNATETQWFQELAHVASAVCFPKGRVRFWHPERVSAPLQGQAVLYLGDRPHSFMDAFSNFGLVLVRP